MDEWLFVESTECVSMLVKCDGEELGIFVVELESSIKVQFLKIEQMVDISELLIVVVVAVGWWMAKSLNGIWCAHMD